MMTVHEKVPKSLEAELKEHFVLIKGCWKGKNENQSSVLVCILSDHYSVDPTLMLNV